MNADGNFYIGNKKINSASGKEEVFDVPVPSNVGETDYKKTDYNIVSSDKVSISKSIKVSGGKNSKDISEFYGPVFFGDKITSTSTKGLESVSVFLQGDETISRKYTISASQPTIAGNPGDIVFNSSPADEELIGWIYTTANQWVEFGDSPGILITTDDSSATRQYLTFLSELTPPEEIEELKDSSKLFYIPATGTLETNKYHGDGGELDNIHSSALIPRDPIKSNDSFENYLYETKKEYTLTSNKTITGNSNYGNTVFTNINTINLTGGATLTVSSGTRFVVGEISGVFEDGIEGIPVTDTTDGYKITGSSNGVIVESNHTGDITITGDIDVTGDIGVVGIITATTATVTGAVNAGDVNTTSDRNLKGNIQVINDPLTLLDRISGVTFNWKDTEQPSVGLIAQEVEEIFPELVSENDRGKAVNYNGIIGLLVECVKQQQREIEQLKNSISNLE